MIKEIATKEELAIVSTISENAEKALKIKTDKDVEKAAGILINIKTEYDTLENKRKEYVKPAQQTVKLLNTDFKKLTEPRSKYITLLKDKIVEYVSIRKKEIKTKEKEIQTDMKDRSLVLDNDMSRIYCDRGELRFRKGYSFKITNRNNIPERYWILDEKAISKDIETAEGNIIIPGIKLATEAIHTVAVYCDK